jgi:hypothetical protein
MPDNNFYERSKVLNNLCEDIIKLTVENFFLGTILRVTTMDVDILMPRYQNETLMG